jgi:S-adenosyl-L-methionine hydrolase (adenosine-forming)
LLITFLTDFGLEDDFVGTCHGVMKRIAPDVEIIDVTHGIAPQSILQGALILANTTPFLPECVHLAVVDPGVGSERRALALRAGNRLFVGPDNGLLIPAAEKVGGVDVAHEITNREYMLEPISATFHGRDVFGPAAAHLASGVDVEQLGPPIQPKSLVRLELPQPEISQRRIRSTCLYIDRFGNMQLNLTRADLESFGLSPGQKVEIEHTGDRYFAVAARTFADARPGEIILYEDAYENVALAISGGNAAQTFNVSAGAEIRIRLDTT